MGKLYRLGDSWSQTMHVEYPEDPNHSSYIAKHYGLEYVNVGYGGASISDLFTQLISIMFECKKDDMLLVGIPSLNRVGYLDRNNRYVNSSRLNEKDILELEAVGEITNEELQVNINNNLLYQINNILKLLDNKGVKIITLYNDSYNFFDTHNKINFDSDNEYVGWVDKMGWKDLSPKGNLHYLYGIQEELAKELIKFIDEKI